MSLIGVELFLIGSLLVSGMLKPICNYAVIFIFVEKIVATEKGSNSILMDGLFTLVRPIIRTMFVGKSSLMVNKKTSNVI